MNSPATWPDVVIMILSTPALWIPFSVVLGILLVFLIFAVVKGWIRLPFIRAKKTGTPCKGANCSVPKLASWLTMMSLKTEKRVADLQYDVIDNRRQSFLRSFRGKMANEYDLEIFWRNIEDVLGYVARHNHILENVQEGRVNPDYLGEKMMMARDRYLEDMDRFESLPQWATVEGTLEMFMIGILQAFADVAFEEFEEAQANYDVLSATLENFPALKALMEDLGTPIKRK